MWGQEYHVRCIKKPLKHLSSSMTADSSPTLAASTQGWQPDFWVEPASHGQQGPQVGKTSGPAEPLQSCLSTAESASPDRASHRAVTVWLVRNSWASTTRARLPGAGVGTLISLSSQTGYRFAQQFQHQTLKFVCWVAFFEAMCVSRDGVGRGKGLVSPTGEKPH